jgi:hypothetical protein
MNIVIAMPYRSDFTVNWGSAVFKHTNHNFQNYVHEQGNVRFSQYLVLILLPYCISEH